MKNKKKQGRKLLSAVLSVLLMTTLIPGTVFAGETGTNTWKITEFEKESGLKTGTVLTVDMTIQNDSEYQKLQIVQGSEQEAAVEDKTEEQKIAAQTIGQKAAEAVKTDLVSWKNQILEALQRGNAVIKGQTVKESTEGTSKSLAVLDAGQSLSMKELSESIKTGGKELGIKDLDSWSGSWKVVKVKAPKADGETVLELTPYTEEAKTEEPKTEEPKEEEPKEEPKEEEPKTEEPKAEEPKPEEPKPEEPKPEEPKPEEPKPEEPKPEEPKPEESQEMIEVTDIIGVPETISGSIELTAEVIPENAERKEILWSTKDAGTTGAAVEGNKLFVESAGTLVLTATVKDGKQDGDFVKEFTITVEAADYAKVDKALAEVPDDLELYTDESREKLEKAQSAVVRGLPVCEQDKVDGYADAIETAIRNLKYKDADYTKVDAALKKIPKDLSVYTDETKKAVEDAKKAVVRGKNITEQKTVDGYADAIEKAVKGLKKKPIEAKAIPKITAGTKQTVAQGKEISFTSDAPKKEFKKVLVDKKEVDKKNYTVEDKNGTKITLKADYVKTLSVGKHTLSIVSEGGQADVTFTVTKASKSPQTGDNTNLLLWIALVAASGCVLGVLARQKRRIK
ncbi:MAG: LPXTG cell wall anchor domain-containing protein [Fusicatenibacter sp.]|nr:LPXTG cell wall anchor domain-containing protein [Fusicatenibacter sp.]